MTSSIKKDYNNVFSEYRKILKVGRSPEVSLSLPHLPPLTAFSAGAETYYFKFQGGILSGGAYAHCAPRLRTPLSSLFYFCNYKNTYYTIYKRDSTLEEQWERIRISVCAKIPPLPLYLIELRKGLIIWVASKGRVVWKTL